MPSPETRNVSHSLQIIGVASLSNPQTFFSSGTPSHSCIKSTAQHTVLLAHASHSLCYLFPSFTYSLLFSFLYGVLTFIAFHHFHQHRWSYCFCETQSDPNASSPPSLQLTSLVSLLLSIRLVISTKLSILTSELPPQINTSSKALCSRQEH